MAATSVNSLAVALKELGWSYTRLIAELRRHASVALPKTESMVTLVSRWVNNHQQPDDFYRDLLSRATGRARAELFGDESVGLATLPWGLVVARLADGLAPPGEVPASSGGDGLIAATLTAAGTLPPGGRHTFGGVGVRGRGLPPPAWWPPGSPGIRGAGAAPMPPRVKRDGTAGLVGC
jgi:hypothetical protein